MEIIDAISGISRLRSLLCFVAKLRKKSGKIACDFPAFVSQVWGWHMKFSFVCVEVYW